MFRELVFLRGTVEAVVLIIVSSSRLSVPFEQAAAEQSMIEARNSARIRFFMGTSVCIVLYAFAIN